MAPPADPYRTLGLGRDATLEQVKRAYRRLAKANHPDTAGEAAVPRFLAIKAAYEAIAGPDATEATRGRRTPTPRRPWEADPVRADATRRAYGARSRGPRPASRPASGPRPAPGPRPDQGPRPADGAAPETDGPERPPNLATLGSTTYDGTEGQPFEPDWGGASWYGTTSGTYWTLNPKEYADPRKHGPEYQARARRARRTDVDPLDAPAPTAMGNGADAAEPAGGADAADGGGAAGAGGGADAAPGRDPADPPGPGGSAGAADPTHTTASWWDATAGAAAEPVIDAAEPLDEPVADDLRERFLGVGQFGVVGRVAFALVGWVPIAAGISALAGELSGCAGTAAGCSAADAPIASFAQLGVLAVLLVVPLLGRLAAMAAAAVLAVAIPASLVAGALGWSAATDSIPVLLAVVLVAAWLVGLAVAGVRESRRTVRPVS